MRSANDTIDDRLTAMREIIKKLRHDDLNNGHCFMIFDDELPDGQAYYEYPDGKINIEELDNDNLDLPRIVIRGLSKVEVHAVKQKHEVFR
jgi:hypothetical protein